MKRRVLWLLALSGLLLLPACGSDNTNVAEELNINRVDPGTVGFTAKFSPGDGVIPFPNNLLYSGTLDGTLNIPVAAAEDFSDPKVAMNALDGFSTIAPMSTSFNRAIDPASLTPSTVRVFEVQLNTLGGTMPVGGPVSGVVGELAYGVDFFATLSSVDPLGQTLVILPLKPLKPRSHYLVALTNGIKDTAGVKAAPDASYFLLRGSNPVAGAAESVRQLINAQEAALAGYGVDLQSVVLSWTFSTQSTEEVLAAARSSATGTAVVVPVSIGTAAQLLNPAASPSNASIYLGSLTVPYYLDKPSAGDPLAALGTFWQGAGGSNLTRFNPAPVVKSDETIPLLVSIPNHIPKPTAGWKVAIYQHGITTNRSTMLAIADTMASAGFAVVAIDMPLHGLPPAHPLYSGIERTFDLDLVDNGTGAPGPDGVADASGTHFINLASLLTSRDNLRQATADLFALTKALQTLAFAGNEFDTDHIYFVGHSLGGIVGSVFLALEPNVKSAVLAMAGGGIAKILDGSATFGPRIAAGLSAKGVVKGTADYESFMGAAQTVIDSADPINHTAAAIVDRGILMFEVIGNGADILPDQVVPNNVMAKAPPGTVPSPLAGTDPLAALMGMIPVSSTTSTSDLGTDLALVRFLAGDHGSILSPAASLEATQVMQGAMATFLATDGGMISISNGGVVE